MDGKGDNSPNRGKRASRASGFWQLELFSDVLGETVDVTALPAVDTRDRMPKYPTLFARCPLFVPDIRHGRTDPVNMGLSTRQIETPWAIATVTGPILDCLDEDVFIAIIHLCMQYKIESDVLAGAGISSFHPHARGMFSYGGVLDLDDICRYIDGDLNAKYVHGTRRAQVAKSIVRMAHVSVTAYAKSDDRPLGLAGASLISYYSLDGGRPVSAKRTTPNQTCLYLIHPALCGVHGFYSRIDLRVRSKLSPIGKAIHRFLSSQPREYKISLIKLQEVCQSESSIYRFRESCMAQLELMVSLGWLESWGIDGRGKRAIVRVRRSAKINTRSP